MRNVKGFILIELLVVVAIVGMLAAIVIPQFATYRQEAYYKSALDTGVTILPYKEWIETDEGKNYRPKKLIVTAKSIDEIQDKKLAELIKQNAAVKTKRVKKIKKAIIAKERLSWDNKNTSRW